jgi:hypothetical protein
MRKHDEQRMEGVVGMVDMRERFRKRDELERAFGFGRYEGTEVVLTGTPEEVVEQIIGWTCVSGEGADCITIDADGVVRRERRP